MKIENFELERFQSLWGNRVDYDKTEIDELLSLRIGYGQTNESIDSKFIACKCFLNISMKP